jgi:hypothetical protein
VCVTPRMLRATTCRNTLPFSERVRLTTMAQQVLWLGYMRLHDADSAESRWLSSALPPPLTRPTRLAPLNPNTLSTTAGAVYALRALGLTLTDYATLSAPFVHATTASPRRQFCF